MPKEYKKCPRCHKSGIINLDKLIMCKNCGEFERSNLELLERGELKEEELLTMGETRALLGSIDFDEEEHTHIFSKKLKSRTSLKY